MLFVDDISNGDPVRFFTREWMKFSNLQANLKGIKHAQESQSFWYQEKLNYSLMWLIDYTIFLEYVKLLSSFIRCNYNTLLSLGFQFLTNIDNIDSDKSQAIITGTYRFVPHFIYYANGLLSCAPLNLIKHFEELRIFLRN